MSGAKKGDTAVISCDQYFRVCTVLCSGDGVIACRDNEGDSWTIEGGEAYNYAGRKWSDAKVYLGEEAIKAIEEREATYEKAIKSYDNRVKEFRDDFMQKIIHEKRLTPSQASNIGHTAVVTVKWDY